MDFAKAKQRWIELSDKFCVVQISDEECPWAVVSESADVVQEVEQLAETCGMHLSIIQPFTGFKENFQSRWWTAIATRDDSADIPEIKFDLDHSSLHLFRPDGARSPMATPCIANAAAKSAILLKNFYSTTDDAIENYERDVLVAMKDLTLQQSRCFGWMLNFKVSAKMEFNKMGDECWDKPTTDRNIQSTIERIRKKLPRAKWAIKICKDSAVWLKRPKKT